jgi:hypothetical protein
MRELSDWYRVRFDDRAVYREAAPPGRDVWADEFAWADLVRVGFKTASLFESDELFFFTSKRAESYLIPVDARGGKELVDEVIRRGLIPPAMMIEAATTEDDCSAGRRSKATPDSGDAHWVRVTREWIA